MHRVGMDPVELQDGELVPSPSDVVRQIEVVKPGRGSTLQSHLPAHSRKTATLTLLSLIPDRV